MVVLLIADGVVLPLGPGGCWLLDHVGEPETAWLWDCRRWPLALARVCLSASESGFGEAGLWDPPSESGVAFLLVGVPALCRVHLSVRALALAFF